MKKGEITTIQGVTLVRDENGIWRDKDGAGYSLEEGSLSSDKKVRLGVGWLSLSEKDKLTRAAKAHDHAFSSQYYKIHHSIEEAEDRLEDHLYKLAGQSKWQRFKAGVLSRISRAVSWLWW